MKSLVVEKFLICDGGCMDGESPFGVDTRGMNRGWRDLREAAATEGWTIKGSKDFCPACSENTGGKNEND